MARLPRICLPGVPQHIIQRGNDRKATFASEEDFAAYAHWLHEYSYKYQVSIHAWVFMTNHVHLLATPHISGGISRMMQAIGRHYVRYFNFTYKRTGTLWEGRFKSCVVDEEGYFLTCQRYIELNPVRAGMVVSPCDYTWSSYCANGIGKSVKFWTPHSVYTELGSNKKERIAAYRSLFKQQLDDGVLNEIRVATNTGMALGNDKFKEEIEQLTGRRVTPLKRGPKARKQNI